MYPNISFGAPKQKKKKYIYISDKRTSSKRTMYQQQYC